MKHKTIVTAVLLAFVLASLIYLVVKETGGRSVSSSEPQKSETPATSQAQNGSRKLVVYYFHGNMRCMTCRTIESYTKEAIQAGFPEALKDGRLEFRVVNVDEPDNEHFVQDYQIVTRSVVIAEFEGSKQKQWKNLSQVWQLVSNKQTFLKYIQDQTSSYLAVMN